MNKHIVIALCIFLSACSGNKHLQKVRSQLAALKKDQAELLLPLNRLDQQREEKWNKGELDEKTDSISRAYISQLKDSISLRLSRLDVLLADKRIRGRKKQSVLDYLNKVKDSYKKEMENILILGDLFNSSTFSRLNTATFFGSGEYKLNDTSSAQVQVLMDRIIADARIFSSKYNTKKLQAMFIVTGYADEEDILPQSKLYKDLLTGINSLTPEHKQLNIELSSRRAISIKNILKAEYALVNEKDPVLNISESFIAIGKGEQLPRGNITDFKPVDERRRVVLIYWSIIPEL